SQPDTVSDQVPYWGFNHAVVAAELPADVQVPPSFEPSIVEAGDLGRLLIVDATDQYAAIGTIPYYLAGKKVLVGAAARSRLITLPAGGAAQHRVERKFGTELHPDGSLDIEAT